MKLQRGPVPLLPGFGENPALLIAPSLGFRAYCDEQIIRFDLLRALQLRRRLAFGCTMAGLLLALTYAIAMWPVDPRLGRILSIALPLALGGFLLGLLAAAVAKRLDPHVYIGADVEQTIGLAPIAVLPDFNEVSEGVANECLLRLAAAIEHVGRNGDLHTCILTGTSRRTGVTTIAERVKDTVSAMGRPAVLLDATGYARDDSPEAEASTALLKQVASRTEPDDKGLTLIDTAPLVLSAESEYFARSVDGVLVIIQSGVTTRAQLLSAVNSLQRLEVRAVGFVLNRVSLAIADPAFRRSLHDMEKHLRNQGVSSSTWPVRWHGFHDDPPRKPEYATREDALPAQSEPMRQSAEFRTPPTIYEFPKAPPELQSPPEPTHDTEIPWWLSPPSSRVEPENKIDSIEACVAEPLQTAPPRIPPPKLPDWFWKRGTNETGDLMYLAEEHAAAAKEQLPLDTESRLERLRGLFSNVGLANLHRSRAPLLAEREQTSPITVAPPAPVNPSAAQPSPAVPLVEKTAEAVVTTQVAAKPERLSPREFIPLKVKQSGSSVESSGSRNEDEVRILPAKRGQYGSR